MNKQEMNIVESKRYLLEGYGALKPGDTIVVTAERSRTSLTKYLRFYSIAREARTGYQRMANLTYHVGIVMKHRLTRNGRVRTTDTADEFVHYLSVTLFGKDGIVDQAKKLDCQILD